MSKKMDGIIRALLIATAVVAMVSVILALLQSSSRLPKNSGPSGSAMDVWGKYVSIQAGAITVTLSKAPTDVSSAEVIKDEPGGGETMTIALPSDVKMNVEYYLGDIVSGRLVNAEPIFWPNLRPGTLLYLQVVQGGRGQWMAQSVAWRQSVSGSQPSGTPAPLPPPEVRRRPPISPP